MNHCKYSQYICKSNCTHIFSGNIFIDKFSVSVAISLKYDFFYDSIIRMRCIAIQCTVCEVFIIYFIVLISQLFTITFFIILKNTPGRKMRLLMLDSVEIVIF